MRGGGQFERNNKMIKTCAKICPEKNEGAAVDLSLFCICLLIGNPLDHSRPTGALPISLGKEIKFPDFGWTKKSWRKETQTKEVIISNNLADDECKTSIFLSMWRCFNVVQKWRHISTGRGLDPGFSFWRPDKQNQLKWRHFCAKSFFHTN